MILALDMILRLLLFSIILSAGCTGKRQTPADTLVVALGSAPSTLDPRLATDANGMRVGALIFNSLVRAGSNFKPEPDAAEKWTFKDNTYTFYLRPDLRFHNGRAVTKEDLEFSFAEFQKPNSPFASILALIREVKFREQKGQLIVDVAVRNFSDKFLLGDLPAVKILPKAETLSAGENFAKILIGTGGYKFKSQSANEIVLESVRAQVPFLQFKVIRDDLTRHQKLLRGEVDIVQADLPVDKVADFEKNPDFQVLRYPGLTMTYILVNFKDPILQKKEVRAALSQAINREEIMRYKMRGFATEATSLLTPNNPYFEKSLRNPAYDLTAAQNAIASLNLKGQSITLKTSNSPQAMDNGKVLAYQMSQSGLKIELQSFEWATFYDDVKKGRFQLATMRWVGTVDPDLYRLAFHSQEVPPGRNRGSYNNPKLDQLLEESAKVVDVKKRMAVVSEVQKIVHDDFAIIPLWYDEQVAVASNRISDYHPVQSGEFWPFTAAKKVQAK